MRTSVFVWLVWGTMLLACGDSSPAANNNNNNNTNHNQNNGNENSAQCGNGVIEAGEECDTTSNSDTEPDACRTDCRAARCGDGVQDTDEVCDGSALGERTCTDLGFTAGNLLCAADCSFDQTACSLCGDGEIWPGESCDGTNLDEQTCATVSQLERGTLGCDSGCQFDTTECYTCSYGAGTQEGSINNLLLYELSGIAASQRNTDVLWTHNDGGESRLYAVGTDSTYLGAYNLVDLETHDWEDIAVGPGPASGTTYVYVGDHGNNGRHRQTVWVHRIPEPDTSTATPPFDIDLTGGETIPLVYPDDRHDVETLLVDPVNGDVYLVTKAYEGPTILFRAAAPLVDGQAVTLQQVNTMDLGSTPNVSLATGGDVSPTGDRIVVRNTITAFVWNRPLGTAFWEAFDGEACSVSLQLELTGEAVGFAADGRSLYTTSEWLNPPLYLYEYNP